MFSITKFIFGSQNIVAEGGNTRALVRDPSTGLVAGGPEQIRQFRGRQGFADEIDLESGRITRQQLKSDVIEMLKVLDQEFKADHGEPLWDASQRDDILGSGFAFNGSSEHLFAPPEVISDEKFIKFKPTVGDIDLIVPDKHMKGLFRTLNRLEDRQLTSKIAYVGHNKKNPVEDQYNALFAYTWDPEAPEGKGDTFFQIDFEGLEFEGGRPTAWAKFSHSSSWRDIEAGVKGLAHKMLCMSIASVVSPPPINARVATDTASAENPRISMTARKNYVPPAQEEIESMIQARADEIMALNPKTSPAAAQKSASAAVNAEVKAAAKRPKGLGAMRSIDLASGYADRYMKLDWKYNGDEVYKYLKRSERTNVTRNIQEIFTGLFGSNPPPNENDLKNFESFLGTLDIMKERMSPPEIVKVYEGMVFRLFGDSAQKISATDKTKDMKVKDRILEVFRQVLPETESSTLNVEELRSNFYAKYKVRGEEGFVETDDTMSDLGESRRRQVRKLVESIIRGNDVYRYLN